MWKIKTFKQRESMLRFLEVNEGRIQFHEIFINNGWGVEYRPLRFIG